MYFALLYEDSASQQIQKLPLEYLASLVKTVENVLVLEVVIGVFRGLYRESEAWA